MHGNFRINPYTTYNRMPTSSINIINFMANHTIIFAVIIPTQTERAFDRAFQFEEPLPSTPRDRSVSSSMGNTGSQPGGGPPPSTPSLNIPSSLAPPSRHGTPHHVNAMSSTSATSVANVSNAITTAQNMMAPTVATSIPHHVSVLSDANSMLARNLR